jgi:hypothetical protein
MKTTQIMYPEVIWKHFIFEPKTYKDSRGRLDIRDVAYGLARWMLANGCVVGIGPLKDMCQDTLSYRITVHCMKKDEVDCFSEILKDRG